jgi:type II secretory pathway component PulF
MAGLASQRSVKTVVGLQARSDPTVLYAADLVKGGYIGEVLTANLSAVAQAQLQRGPGRIWQGVRANGANTLTIANGHTIDAMLLRLPILGLILRKIAVARFCRTLSTLISSGVPILDGLEITAKTAGNAIVEDAIMATRKSIERGETVSAPLKETKVFPPMVTQMIGVGEATGALDTMLAKIAEFYEEEVDTAVAGLLTLLEPVMIAVLGGIVGGIVIAMYLPIFSLISKLT